ncbi:MAG: cobyrinate a,c-diamide synthase [Planctomycetota bacterium]|nr:cobyrinate a,c-diamide synthase [Planctomycetota bacterium]
MSVPCPRIVIAGTHSGVGKTSLTLGLARWLTRRGLRVQTFKVGPDFLDPTYLARASGRTCYNLDGWMTSREYVQQLFAQTTADADIAVIEGVMGLFDGASPTGLEGSTAEIAVWLAAPVLLVASAHGAARSLAATAKGFAAFEAGVRVAGVIANQGGSDRHRQWLAEALAAAAAPPLVGMVPRGALPTLPSRHLGLVAADHAGLTFDLLDQLADACQQHVDVVRLLELAALGNGPKTASAFALPPLTPTLSPEYLGEGVVVRPPLTPTLSPEYRGEGVVVRPTLGPSPTGQLTNASSVRVRLGLAQDEAFHFYYPDNLAALRRYGAELVPFSPLADTRLPADLDVLYFGGGYPEVHAARLADNASLLADVRHFVASGGRVYGECGGLMYLGRTLTTLDNVRFPLAGVLPLDTAMLPKLKVLGYAEVCWATDTLWGRTGGVCRGHEFHYSEITAEDGQRDGWQPAYTIRRRRGQPDVAGFANSRVLAGYVHLHWASRPDAVLHFLSQGEPHT